MAGDWIKFEVATLDKPEVCLLAEMLEIPETQVIGCLLSVWNWFDKHTENGNACVTLMKRIVTLTGVTGFPEAMQEVGWLVVKDGEMYLPNWERHNSKSAKKRALTNSRVKKYRETQMKRKCNAKNVTREEKNIKKYIKKDFLKSKTDNDWLKAGRENGVEPRTGEPMSQFVRRVKSKLESNRN